MLLKWRSALSFIFVLNAPSLSALSLPKSCVLKSSGPVTATRNGQVIENLKISAVGKPAIQVDGYSDVTIRNVLIEHSGAAGIVFNRAAGLHIENASLLQTGSPTSGKNPDDKLVNILGMESPDVVVKNVRLEKGSSGIYLVHSPRAKLSFIEGHDFRGPSPRGQLVQFDHSDDGVLEDFSCENDSHSWPEDNVSVWRSSNVNIRRGLLDGNNSPSGVAVMFEQDEGHGSGGMAEDIDAVHQGDGCFSAYPARNVTFKRTRCLDNICTDQGRGRPRSGGLAWTVEPGKSSGIKILDSSYAHLCKAKLIWDEKALANVEVKEAAITPRAPTRIGFCWQ